MHCCADSEHCALKNHSAQCTAGERLQGPRVRLEGERGHPGGARTDHQVRQATARALCLTISTSDNNTCSAPREEGSRQGRTIGIYPELKHPAAVNKILASRGDKNRSVYSTAGDSVVR